MTPEIVTIVFGRCSSIMKAMTPEKVTIVFGRCSSIMKAKTQKRIVRNGFTLIEMMIVIGIIALLAALTLGISNSVLRNSEIRRTEDVLKLLSMAIQEWELEKGRSITFKGAGTPQGTFYDIDPNPQNPSYPFDPYSEFPDPDFSSVNAGEDADEVMEDRMERLIIILQRSEASKDILAKISPSHYVDNGQGKLVVDAWGNHIGIVFPERPFLGSDLVEMFASDQSGDLTVRGLAEDGLGSCINLRPYFVSAGPDGVWGYRFQTVMLNDAPDIPDVEKWKASHDNIYSYEPFIVEEAR